MNTVSYQQLSNYLNTLINFKKVSPPAKGWIRALRNGLGMSRRQLGSRMGVSVSRIQKIEEDENSGAVTIKTMRRAAEAMDCVFVYAVIPRTDLESSLKTQAFKKAKRHLQNTSHSMSLEDQSIDKKANDEMLKSISEKLMTTSQRTLWDD